MNSSNRSNQLRFAIASCIVALSMISCSEMGKKYITVNVDSNPSGATVDALIDGKSTGLFTPRTLGTTPLINETMYFAFGAPGAGGTKIGIRVSKPGYKDFEVLFSEDECYSSAEEAQWNLKHIYAELELLADSTIDESKINEKNRRVELSSYYFEVPINWEVGGSEEEKYMKDLLNMDPNFKITALSTFGMSEGAIVTVYTLSFARDENEDYIDRLFNLNITKLQEGKSNGLVKEVYENKKLKKGQFDALLIDWISTQGAFDHSRQWVLSPNEAYDNVLIVVVYSDSQTYPWAKQSVDKLVESIRVSNTGI